MNQLLENQLRKIEEREARSCQTKKKEENPLQKKIAEKIPEGLEEKLEKAFTVGFKIVFKKGDAVIEKTYDKEKRQQDYDIRDFTLERRKNKKALWNLNLESDRRKWGNLGLTALEGSALGLFGIGLPDIPVFIGMLLKSVYEAAMSYGFDYKSEEERYYILKVMEAALLSGKERKEKLKEADETAGKLAKNIVLDSSLDEQIQKTAKALAEEMLYMKVLQGIPIAGVLGGIANVKCMNKIAETARLKYQKRYLLKKIQPE